MGSFRRRTAAGFPLITGPILLLLAIDHGPVFASTTAVGSIAAVLANVSFGIGYAWAAVRYRPSLCLLAGFVCFALAVLLQNTIALSLYPTFLLTLAGLWIAPKVFPRNVASAPLSKPFPGELLIRMLAGATITLVVTMSAEMLGPRLSGLFAVFPVLASVFAYFSHRYSGAGLAIDLLRAMAKGFYAFAVFCFVVSFALPIIGIAHSFLIALASTILVQTMFMSVRPSPAAQVSDSQE